MSDSVEKEIDEYRRGLRQARRKIYKLKDQWHGLIAAMDPKMLSVAGASMVTDICESFCRDLYHPLIALGYIIANSQEPGVNTILNSEGYYGKAISAMALGVALRHEVLTFQSVLFVGDPDADEPDSEDEDEDEDGAITIEDGEDAAFLNANAPMYTAETVNLTSYTPSPLTVDSWQVIGDKVYHAIPRDSEMGRAILADWPGEETLEQAVAECPANAGYTELQTFLLHVAGVGIRVHPNQPSMASRAIIPDDQAGISIEAIGRSGRLNFATPITDAATARLVAEGLTPMPSALQILEEHYRDQTLGEAYNDRYRHHHDEMCSKNCEIGASDQSSHSSGCMMGQWHGMEFVPDRPDLPADATLNESQNSIEAYNRAVAEHNRTSTDGLLVAYLPPERIVGDRPVHLSARIGGTLDIGTGATYKGTTTIDGSGTIITGGTVSNGAGEAPAVEEPPKRRERIKSADELDGFIELDEED